MHGSATVLQHRSIDALTLVGDAWKLECADGRDHAELEISQSAFTPTTVRAEQSCDATRLHSVAGTTPSLAVRCGVPLHQPNISGITPRVNPPLWLKHNHPSRKATTLAPCYPTWFYPAPGVLPTTLSTRINTTNSTPARRLPRIFSALPPFQEGAGLRMQIAIV